MSKNTKKAPATEEAPVTTFGADIDLDTELTAHLSRIDELIADTINNSPADPTPAPVKAKKAKKAKAEPKKAEPLQFDLAAILANTPDEFTPAFLDKAFNLNDGGKTVRRHLRNHFAEAMTHNKKDKWTFAKADSNDIITYFASRYAFTAPVVTTTPEVQA